MELEKKHRRENIVLFIIFIAGIVLQFVGSSKTGYLGLGIQLVSLAIIILVLYLYNRRYT